MRTIHKGARVLALAAVAVAASAAPAFAQSYPGGTVTTVKEVAEVLGTVQEQQPAPVAVIAAQEETLPVTGGDIIGLTLLGGGLVAGGVVLVRRSRRTAVVGASA